MRGKEDGAGAGGIVLYIMWYCICINSSIVQTELAYSDFCQCVFFVHETCSLYAMSTLADATLSKAS